MEQEGRTKFGIREARALGQAIRAELEGQRIDAALRALEPVLLKKTPFHLLDALGEQIGGAPEDARSRFLEGVVAQGQMGGWVVIGSLLRVKLQASPLEALQQARQAIVAADVWYGTDILGERVPGQLLADSFDTALPVLEEWRTDPNAWVRRAVGVAVHYWVKRSGTQSGGTQSGGTQSGGTQSGGTQSGGTQSGGTQSGGTQSGGTQSGGTQSGGTQSGGTQSGGTQSGGTQSGGTQSGGGQGAGGEAQRVIQARRLLELLDPLFEVTERDAIKGVGWGLKALGRTFPPLLEEWLVVQGRERKRRPRALMLAKALTYLDERAQDRVLEAFDRVSAPAVKQLIREDV